MAKKQRQNKLKSGGSTSGATNITSTVPSAPPSSPTPSQQQLMDQEDISSEFYEATPRNQQHHQSQTSLPTNNPHKSLSDWISAEREGLLWILGCAAFGALIGFGVGCGWFTNGHGSYQYTLVESPATGVAATTGTGITKEYVKKFVISAWRVALARRIRSSFAYELLTFQRGFWNIIRDVGDTSDSPHWIAKSSWWAPNWILHFDVDTTQISAGDAGFSPLMASFLSFVLPWRRPLIRAMTRKNINEYTHSVPMKGMAGAPSSAPFTPASSSTTYQSTVDPFYHPMAFHALREYVVRFDKGVVHPDLGFLVPAPSGASRGIGMVRDSYSKCQIDCFPGTAEEANALHKQSKQRVLESKKELEIMEEMKELYPDMIADETEKAEEKHEGLAASPESRQRPLNTTTKEEIQMALHHQSTSTAHPYTQDDILLRIPLRAQITRDTALEILNPLYPDEMKKSIPLEDLDDALLLALLLTHEKELGPNSRFWPYIATLPPHPSCALHRGWRQSIVDVVTSLSLEMGTDVQSWPNEISKAADYMDRIVSTLSGVYGHYIEEGRTDHRDVQERLRWSLCQVASRAIAGRDEFGSLRLVPMMDLINHDEAAGKFMELTGNEGIFDGIYFDADEVDGGTFVVRSRRHGRRKVLKKGQELLANYNVPHYSPLDWFLNMGYIPPEREGRWTMLESALPRGQRGGFSRESNLATQSGAFGNGKPEIQVIRQHMQLQPFNSIH